MSDLVSIITPVYNARDVLSECLDSVREQTYTNWEHLLIEDHSNDDSYALLNDAAKSDSRVQIFRTVINSGAGAARNLGIRAARGRYIAFLDADDRWLPEKLSIQIAIMRQRNWVLSYSDYRKFGDGPEGERIVHAPASVTYRKLLRSNTIGCLTAVYDARILGKREMPLIRCRQDWGLWLSILKEGFVGHSVGQVLSEYRVHSHSLSANKWKAIANTWNFYRQTLSLGLLKSCCYFIQYLVQGFLKYMI